MHSVQIEIFSIKLWRKLAKLYGKPHKKFLPLMAGQFFGTVFFQRSKISTAIKLEGGGLGINGPAIKRKTFFLRLQYPMTIKIKYNFSETIYHVHGYWKWFAEINDSTPLIIPGKQKWSNICSQYPQFDWVGLGLRYANLGQFVAGGFVLQYLPCKDFKEIENKLRIRRQLIMGLDPWIV